MMSWARVIGSYRELPDIYKFPCQKLIASTETLPYTVLAPAQGGVWYRKSAERLLFDVGNTFYVLERSGSQVTTIGFPYSDISSLEVGNILLYSWFSINGKTDVGSESTQTIEFNEATLRHFAPFLCKFRPAPDLPPSASFHAERAKFDNLSTENFKFMNFARDALLPGQRVIQSIYQPVNRRQLIHLFGRHFYRTFSLAHLTILTDQEIILISDAEKITEKQRSKYGGVLRYLRLSSLESVSLQQLPNEFAELTLKFSSGLEIKKLFDPHHRLEVEKLTQALRALSPN